MARFANTIDNQPIYAARAEADKNGDRIDTTYLKVADLPAAPVQDVEVDGTSVVNAQGVAEITMPTVPTATSELTNDSGFITASDVAANQEQADWTESDSSNPSYIQHKPDLSIYAQSANLATVATSGNYNDLSNLPTIPPAVTVDQHYDAQSSNPQSGTAVAEALSGTGQVPTVTSSDDSKVLTATYSGGKGSYSWQPASASTQVNADWEATSGVAEILHKPDLSVYAETADLATVATTGDYDDLVDAPTIVGLAAGANVTITEANNTVTIAATDTTYTAGTGISISGGAISNSDPIPSHTSTQSGKVLGVDSNGDLDWVTPAASQVQADWNESDSSAPSFIQNKPTIPSVDQFFNPASTNAQSGTAVAGALSNISQVPPTSQASAGDVLTVDQYGDAAWVAPSAQAQEQSDWTESDPTAVSYIQHKPTQKPLVAGQNVVLTEGANNITIDCTASGGGGSYTAGDGIDITAGEISVKAGTGLEIGTASKTVTAQAVGLTQHINSGNYDSVNVIQPLNPDIFVAIGNDTATVTLSTVPVTDSDFTNWKISGGAGKTAYVVIAKLSERAAPNSGWSLDTSKAMFLGVAVQTLDADGAVPKNVAYNVHASDNTDTDSTLTWSELTTALAGGTISDYAIFIARKATTVGTGVVYPSAAMCSHITGVVDGKVATGSVTYTATVANALNVTNPLPDSTSSDANKVLKVNASGAPEWATGGGSTYSAGTGIDITDDVISVEAPVDIVAGPGIVIDNPDGNTLRVSQAYPTDETVLYDKSDAQGATLASPAISLSESIFNFERIKIYWKNWNSGYSRIVNEFDSPSDNVFFNCMGAFYTSTSAVIFVLNINKNADGTALNFDKGTFCTFGNTNVNNASNTIIYKVVGVHRIANN